MFWVETLATVTSNIPNSTNIYVDNGNALRMCCLGAEEYDCLNFE